MQFLFHTNLGIFNGKNTYGVLHTLLKFDESPIKIEIVVNKVY